MDLRVVKTKRSIKAAFLELRRKKPIEKITVKELADLAMINKGTFYLHYQDIYNLSDEIENEFIDDIIKDVPELEPGEEGLNYPLITKKVMIAMYNRGEEANALFSYGRDWILVTKVENILLKKFSEGSALFADNPELEIAVRILSRGTFSLSLGGEKYDRETILNTVTRMAEQLTKTYSNITEQRSP